MSLAESAPRLEERGRVRRAFEGRGVDVNVVDASQTQFAAVYLLRRGDADSGNVGSAASASIEQDLSMHQIGSTLA